MKLRHEKPWLKFDAREEKNMQRNSKTTDSKEAISTGIDRLICAISELCAMVIELPDLILYKSIKKNPAEDYDFDC